MFLSSTKNLIYLAVIVIGGVALAALFLIGKNSASTGIYCSPDGTLSQTQTIQSHRSYCIKSNITSLNASPGTPISYSFSIIDEQGKEVKDFRLVHDKLLHLIVVRKDLNQFQHLHLEFDSKTGIFTLSNLTFPTAGDYRIFADFTPVSAMTGSGGLPLGVTISEDITIAGPYTPQALETSKNTQTADGYTISLAADPKVSTVGVNMFSFTISKDGKVITDLDPYLGALGHAVVLRHDTLEYVHVHALETATSAQNGTIRFHVEFPEKSNYKMFLQFQRDGKIVTTSFLLPVSDGTTLQIHPKF